MPKNNRSVSTRRRAAEEKTTTFKELKKEVESRRKKATNIETVVEKMDGQIEQNEEDNMAADEKGNSQPKFVREFDRKILNEEMTGEKDKKDWNEENETEHQRQQQHQRQQTNDGKDLIDKQNCDNLTDCDKEKQDVNTYLHTDKGPFIVHITEKVKSDREVVQEIHDVVIGLKLKRLKVKGIREVKKVSRRELKVIFDDKKAANDFLKGKIPEEIGVVAAIPRYNVNKVGIIFDIPVKYSEEYLKQNLEAEVPIVEVYRCQKKKIVDGKKTKEWMAANTVKVTFRGQAVPDEVVFGYSKRKVKPDVPLPTQCFNCIRFGHVNRFCKQEKPTCNNCGTQHEFSRDKPCERQMKCFHCHSDQHDGTSKNCPEYLRNVLIKETMFYGNVTFSEANEKFPMTRSQYRIAENTKEFPSLPNRGRGPAQEKERIEESFPRKTVQEIRKQYEDYVQLNGGKPVKPSPLEEKAETYSQVTKKQTTEEPQVSERIPRGDGRRQTGITLDQRGRDALDLITDLSYKLEVNSYDPSQRPQTAINNDLILIEVGRMITEFLNGAERRMVNHSQSDVDQDP